MQGWVRDLYFSRHDIWRAIRGIWSIILDQQNHSCKHSSFFDLWSKLCSETSIKRVRGSNDTSQGTSTFIMQFPLL